MILVFLRRPPLHPPTHSPTPAPSVWGCLPKRCAWAARAAVAVLTLEKIPSEIYGDGSASNLIVFDSMAGKTKCITLYICTRSFVPPSLEAVAAGTFKARGAIGSSWQRAMKNDPHLKARYDAAGRNYDLQHQVKVEWMQGKIKMVEQKIKIVSSTTDSETMRGVHLPLSAIVWEQKNKTQGVNYVMNAIKKHMAGKSVRGKPWAAWNNMTLAWEFLYITQSFETMASRSHISTKIMATSSATNSQVPAYVRSLQKFKTLGLCPGTYFVGCVRKAFLKSLTSKRRASSGRGGIGLVGA